jgi:hypothetical protein
MSDLQGTPQQHNLPSIFYQNEDGNFCLCCCGRSSCLFCCCLGQCQLIVCIPANVACVMHGASVTWLCFLLFFTSSLLPILFALNVLVAGDLRHGFA